MQTPKTCFCESQTVVGLLYSSRIESKSNTDSCTVPRFSIWSRSFYNFLRWINLLTMKQRKFKYFQRYFKSFQYIGAKIQTFWHICLIIWNIFGAKFQINLKTLQILSLFWSENSNNFGVPKNWNTFTYILKYFWRENSNNLIPLYKSTLHTYGFEYFWRENSKKLKNTLNHFIILARKFK